MLKRFENSPMDYSGINYTELITNHADWINLMLLDWSYYIDND